ncbi:hypothetical protein R8871_00001 [Paraburkholderia graminis C4D1M]|nr:hypothetical protein R8871_00001 [Paraburkholderia graminis C4D1M]
MRAIWITPACVLANENIIANAVSAMIDIQLALSRGLMPSCNSDAVKMPQKNAAGRHHRSDCVVRIRANDAARPTTAKVRCILS